MRRQPDDIFNTRSVFAGFTNLGAPAGEETLLDNYTGPKDEHVGGDFIPGTQIIKTYGEQDLNEVVVNEPYVLHDEETFDDDAFTGADQYKVNPHHFPTYQDWAASLKPGQKPNIRDYEDFLGINFKKIGHDIGKVFHGAEHAVGSVGKTIGHGASWLGKSVGNDARKVAAGLEHAHDALGKDIGKLAKNTAHTIGHGVVWTAHEFRDHHAAAEKITGNIIKKDWRYIADGLVVAGAVALAVTGVGIPAAAALLTGGLSAINSIPQPQPDVPFLPGGGGGDGPTDADIDPDGNTLDDMDPDNLQGNDYSVDDIQDPKYMPAQGGPVAQLPQHHYLRSAIIAVVSIGILFWLIHKRHK